MHSRLVSFFGMASVPGPGGRESIFGSTVGVTPAFHSRKGVGSGLQRTDAVDAERSLLLIRTVFFGFSSSAARWAMA